MRSNFPYPVLLELLKPFHWRQQKTITVLLSAILESGSACSMSIASWLARMDKIRSDSALNRFYRFLRNPRIDTLLNGVCSGQCIQMAAFSNRDYSTMRSLVLEVRH